MLLLLFFLLSWTFAEIIFADNGNYFKFSEGTTDVGKIEEMIRGGYKKSNFYSPSRTIVLTLKTSEDIPSIPEGYNKVSSDTSSDYIFNTSTKNLKVYDTHELAKSLASCGRECFIDATLTDPGNILESLLKYRDALVVVNYLKADAEKIIHDHKMETEFLKNRLNQKQTRKIAKNGKVSSNSPSGIRGRFSSAINNIDCYNEQWVEYIIPNTDSVKIANNQSIFWTCFVVAVAFLVVALWMWFMKTDDPEDFGSMMAMDNNLCPVIEEERWENEQ